MKSVQNVVQRWVQNTGSTSAKQKYIESINAVTESPMAKAAAADDLYLRKIEESVRSGRRAAKLNATPISRWRDSAIKKGADRMAGGAAASADKMTAHMTKWLPIYDGVSQAVSAMPKGGREEAKARAAKAIDMLMDAAGK